MSGRRLVFLGLAVVAAAVAGCDRGPGYTFAPVEGVVTRGGRPLANVVVEFYTDPASGGYGPRAMAMTDVGGRYRLSGDKGEVGAVVGRHRVCLIDNEAALANILAAQQRPADPPSSAATASLARAGVVQPSGRPAARSLASIHRVPPEYARYENTPLRAEVLPEGGVIDFTVP